MALHIQLAPKTCSLDTSGFIPAWLTRRLNIISECLSELTDAPHNIHWYRLLSHLIYDGSVHGNPERDPLFPSTAPPDIQYVLARSHLPACFRSLKEFVKNGILGPNEGIPGLAISGMRFAMNFANSQAPDAKFDNQFSATMDNLQVLIQKARVYRWFF